MGKENIILPLLTEPSNLQFYHTMILYILLFASMAFADVIKPGSILRPPAQQWKSLGGNFSLGFHSREDEKYVVGIGFANINDNTLVWTAGRGGIGDGASLRFQSDGDLVFYDHLNNVVWKSNTANKGVVSAEMRDNGNFVLLDRSSGVVWESFGNPTDTLVVGQEFTVGKTLSADPYSFKLEDGGNFRLQWRNNITYWNASASSETSGALNLSLSNQGILTLSNSSDYLWIARSNDYTDNSITIRRVTLDSDGNLRMYAWVKGSGSWQTGWSAVNDQCRIYGYCGNYGVCVYNSTGPQCVCPSLDFTALDPNDPRQGCTRLDDIGSCANNQSMVVLEHTGFLLYPPESESDSSLFYLGYPDCWENCLKNPSCSATTLWSDGSGTCQMMNSSFNSAYALVTNPSASYVKVCGAGRPYDLLSPPASLPSPSPFPEPEPETGLEVQIYIYVAGQNYPVF